LISVGNSAPLRTSASERRIAFKLRFVKLRFIQNIKALELNVKRNVIIGSIIGLVVGFGIGFVFANSVNRRETEQLRAELSSGVQSTQPLFPAEGALAASATPAEVSNEEMQAAIARADAEPRDIFLQRNLGQYLYLYSAQPGGAKVLPDAIRLLERAYRNDPDNYDTLVLLGNANFNLAQATDAKRFAEARTFYEKALRVKPRDARMRIDLGLTYSTAIPPIRSARLRNTKRCLPSNRAMKRRYKISRQLSSAQEKLNGRNKRSNNCANSTLTIRR
jgi:tetratricopeptide (TPR) repeat protein